MNSLKRCCYILVNNWETKRESDCVVALVEDFAEFDGRKRSVNKERGRLQGWIQEFIDSQDYEDLRLFAIRHDHHNRLATLGIEHWSKRYTSYLLVPQYADSQNSPEQRQAARQLSHELKDKFKFELAMYTARSQSSVVTQATKHPAAEVVENPTGLGDQVLQLIKRLIVRRGQFSHTNLAHIFLKQTDGVDYETFKDALYNYLIFAVDARDPEDSFHQQLYARLRSLYPKYNDRAVSQGDALILRTCNRLFDLLTTEDGQQPSELFVLLLSQGNPLMLAIMLLKVVLICPSARTHLESRIAVLIRYYMQFPEADCQWVVNFFEIFNITFAIYADQDVQYNLVHYDEIIPNGSDRASKRKSYRIFSQHASNSDRELADGRVDPLEISP
ncbi:MAG: hypothetical protein HC838_08730 [Spirulinaceae cyanobacterium RM2_2_10]|nr:hypothetical protein [Spirulinaceae cyanobacterium RM2_2_10]